MYKTKKKSVAIVMRRFSEDAQNDPFPVWKKFAKQLKKENDVGHVSIFGGNYWEIYQKSKLNTFDEVYIVASYFSAPIYLTLFGKSKTKRVYLLRNRVDIKEYLKVLKKHKFLVFDSFYLLSSFKLGLLYRLLTKLNQISLFIFPSQTSLDEFTKDTKVHSDKCVILSSPLQKEKLIDHKTSTTKDRDEKWIVCTGRSSTLRGIGTLVEAFEKMYRKDKSLKLVCLLLPDTNFEIAQSKIKTLPKESYILKTNKLKNADYAGMIKQADVFVGPYNFSYGFPARPATLLETMYLGVPTVVSDTVNDHFFKNNHNCLKFKNMDALDLMNKIDTVLKKINIKKKIVNNAKRSLRKDPDFLGQYEKIVNFESDRVTKDFDKRAKTYGSWFAKSVGTKYVDKLEKEILLKTVGQNNKLKISEVGPGKGRIAEYLINKLKVNKYYGVEVSSKMKSELEKKKIPKLKVVLASGANYKLKEKMDVAISIRQIKYNFDYLDQLRSMQNSLKKGGLIVIEFPSIFSVSGLRKIFLSTNDVLFNPFKLEKQMHKLGFENIKMESLRYLPDDIYMLTKSMSQLKLITYTEKLSGLILPPLFAKSILLTATKPNN